jgi:hypothetical protein
MKYPKEWSKDQPAILGTFSNQFRKLPASLKVEADGDTARWWTELSEEGKQEYVTEHPHSKYADMHRKSKVEPIRQSIPKADKTPSKIGDHKSYEVSEENNTSKSKVVPKPSLRDFVQPDFKPGSPKRKAIVGFLRKKSSHIISHVKHDAKEWKTAGLALKKLATGKSLEHGDKQAIGAVAADLAAVTASLMLTGGAGHGILVFMHHFGTHLAQEMLLKAAVKGTVGAHPHEHPVDNQPHASMITSASHEDEILEEALKLMMDVLENGDLEELIKKFEKEAVEEGKGKEAKKDLRSSISSTELRAKLDMSAEVAGRGLCPDCKQPMKFAIIAGNPSWACETDRISLPLPDNHEYFNKQTQNEKPLVGF